MYIYLKFKKKLQFIVKIFLLKYLVNAILFYGVRGSYYVYNLSYTYYLLEIGSTYEQVPEQEKKDRRGRPPVWQISTGHCDKGGY